MKLLAIDTSSHACSVALAIGNDVKVIHEIAPMKHAQMILPMINQLMQSYPIAFADLDALALGCGPGSFTGVRIAISVMQGLGFAHNLPLIPISSLAALAQAAFEDLGWERLLVAIDARIQEVYAGAYQVNAQGIVELQGFENVYHPTGLIFPDQNDWAGVGNAWDIYSDQINIKPAKIDMTRLPTAKGVVDLAKVKYQNQEWTSAASVAAVYLRNEVAQKS